MQSTFLGSRLKNESKIERTTKQSTALIFFVKNTVVSHLLELALIGSSRLFEVISVSLGFSLSSHLKFPSVILTCSYSKFCLFEVISLSLGPKNSQIL